MFHNKTTLLLILSSVCWITAAQISVNLSKAEIPQTVVPILPEKDVTSTSTTTTTTAAPKTTPSTTTAAPKTTPSTTTTSTTTTTTPAPTTKATTTTEAPVTTTTAAPTPAPTPTPTPKPYPEPEVGTWNSSCIMVRMAVQLNFTYETKDNKTAHTLYNIPKNAVVDDAHCDMNTTQFLQINWGPREAQNSMTLQFDNVNGTANMSMLMFTLSVTTDSFPDAKGNTSVQLIHRGGDFSAPLKMSYHCTRPQIFNLTETIMNTTVTGTAKVHNVQVEAFRAPNAAGFSSARDCDSSETADVAPIAVGIVLGALILIVLITYLCARRRSAAHGYMSF